MNDDDIKEYRDAIGKRVQLFGYTSTSKDKSLALTFAWDNQDSGHHKVCRYQTHAHVCVLGSGANR